MGGQNKLRPLWRHYYDDSKSLAFVIDSQDRERLDEARQELFKVAEHPKVGNACILIFMNKIDLPNGNSRDNHSNERRGSSKWVVVKRTKTAISYSEIVCKDR